MTNSENGASTSMANENATGNTNYQCLGDGQSMMDDAGQNGCSNNEQPCIGSNNEQPGIGLNEEQPGIGSNEEQPGIGYRNAGGANASIPQHANARFPKIPATDGRDFGSKFKGKQSFASLFKDNRAPNDESKLHFIAPSPLGELEIVSEDVDSVEKSFGFSTRDSFISGESIKVDVNLRNSLQIPLSISNVSLVCEYSAESNETESDSSSTLIDYQNALKMRAVSTSGDESLDTSFFTLSEVDILMQGGETISMDVERR